jgi:hypothetical protein
MPIKKKKELVLGPETSENMSALPSLVGKCMIVQLLVRKHAPKKDKTKRCMGFTGLKNLTKGASLVNSWDCRMRQMKEV